MARTSTNYDLWLTASNRAYRGVPFSVVTDWLQQGRILPTDKIRPEGGGEWLTIAASPAFAAFVPHDEAPAADDAAEALEPLHTALPVRRHSEDDDDVDMIPLIDISLVLLIFFMMTATVAIGGSKIDTPQTLHGVEFTQDKSMLWIGVDRRDGGRAVYSIGQGDMQAETADSELALEQLLAKLDIRLRANGSGTIVRLAGHKQLPYGVMQKLTAELEKRRGSGKITDIKAEVNEKSS
jgi:biopolymer transport protein ExbD